MIFRLLKFEGVIQRKQRALLLLSIIFFIYGLLLGSQGYAPANVDFNSGYQIHYYTGIMTLGCAFIAMFFAISGVIRDKKHQMEDILFSTPVSKFNYFMSRFGGVLLFSILAFLPYLVGHILGTFSPQLDPERLTDLNLTVYLQTWLIFILPNTFISIAPVFAIALLTRNNLATYIGGILVS